MRDGWPSGRVYKGGCAVRPRSTGENCRRREEASEKREGWNLHRANDWDGLATAGRVTEVALECTYALAKRTYANVS